MSKSEKPTVLFVHGAWHSPKHWAPAARVFEEAGYPTSCPCQPSFGAQPPTTEMYEDSACIRTELDRLIEREGKDVLLVMHSYGGIVGTEAANASLSKATRMARGLTGGILGLVYICAFVLPEGESLGSTLGELPPYIAVEEDGSCKMEDPVHRFYNDVPESEQQHWVSELKPHPLSAQLTPQTYLGYKHHPASYIFCENDQALPVDLQERMVKNVGVEMRTERLPCGHSPFLSMPEKFLAVVQKVAGV